MVDVLEGLVRALPEMWARRVRSVPDKDDSAFVPRLQLGAVVEAVLCVVTDEQGVCARQGDEEGPEHTLTIFVAVRTSCPAPKGHCE